VVDALGEEGAAALAAGIAAGPPPLAPAARGGRGGGRGGRGGRGGGKSAAARAPPPPPLPPPSELVGASAKLQLLVLLLREAAAEGAKVLIFSQQTRMLDILAAVTGELFELEPDVARVPPVAQGAADASPFVAAAAAAGARDAARGLRAVRLDGACDARERAAAVAAFNSDPSIAIALLSTGVGSLGLTMTAATRVVLFEPLWNPAIEAQAVDRA
jgi:hypothetical protein